MRETCHYAEHDSAQHDERKEAEAIAKRRATVASLRAEIWGAFGDGASSDQILGIWTELVQRHLDVPEVQIWTLTQSGSALTLHSRTGAAAHAGDGTSAFEVLEPDIRKVGETDVPVVIPDIGCDPRLGSCEVFQQLAIRAVMESSSMPVL